MTYEDQQINRAAMLLAMAKYNHRSYNITDKEMKEALSAAQFAFAAMPEELEKESVKDRFLRMADSDAVNQLNYGGGS